MAYMIYQQYKTAVSTGYADKSASEIADELQRAAACRGWIESLAIDPKIRAGLGEQIGAIEQALEELLRRPDGVTAAG